MMACRRFRILTPDGRLSSERFYISAEQPCGMQPGYLLVVHERTGQGMAVADTRLFPAEAIARSPLSVNATNVCLTRGASAEQSAPLGGRCDHTPPTTACPASPHIQLSGTGV